MSTENQRRSIRRGVSWSLACCSAIAICGGAISSAAEPRLAPRITQEEVENDLGLTEIRRHGLRIFSTPFNIEDGLGDGPVDPLDKVSPGGRPSLHNNGMFLRMNGLDSQTCLECHNYLSNAEIPAVFAVGGVGGVGESAFPGVIDPDIDDSDDNGYADMQGRMINPPFSFGSGGVEAVGKEMTKALQALKAQAQANPGMLISLIAKGIDFGTLSHDGVDFDFSNVEGIDSDLVIRPFGRTACCATVREFDVGATQFHHGMQPAEVVGDGVDADGDGVANELLEGELSAMHIFQVSLERPRAEHEHAHEKNKREKRKKKKKKKKAHKKKAANGAGERLFDEIGCASCHTPVLHTKSRYLTLSLPEVSDDPDANAYFSINLTRRAPGFEPSGSGVAVPLYADLKLHDMGAGLIEGDGNTVFTTARLWGVADTAPYMHDGRAPTLRNAIALHGGEAQDAADEFGARSPAEQDALLDFLKTLRTPRFPNQGL